MDHRRQKSGTIYLLHFETKIANHAQHYLGFAVDLPTRLSQHQAGNGSRLMARVHELSIGWCAARTWKGDRDFERKLKNRRNGPRLCPICHPKKIRAEIPF